MSKLDEIIQKIPRPILVGGVLILTLAFIVSQNPLKDGCDIEVENFGRQIRGILKGFKTKSSKIQFAQIDTFRDLCKDSNSQGGCDNYFQSLKKITDGLQLTDEKCMSKIVENYENLPAVLGQGIKIMALAAWGETPPAGLANRLGWLTQTDVYTFCRMKNKLSSFVAEEEFESLKQSVYLEFPDKWPEGVIDDKGNGQSNEDTSGIGARPKALRNAMNPTGSLSEKEVYERSLFSLRCDLYL